MQQMNDEELLIWLKNKKVNLRRKIFLVLSISNQKRPELSRMVNSDRSYIWRTLAKMQIDYYVKQDNEKKWYLTSKGIKHLKRSQKNGFIPIRKA